MDVLKIQVFEERFEPASKAWTLCFTTSASAQPQKVLLEDPSSPEVEREFLWYWEDFALQDPFEKSRALAAERNLLKYAETIRDAVEEALAGILRDRQYTSQEVVAHLVIKSEGSKSSLQRLHWELLENLDLWLRLPYALKSIQVSRQIMSVEPSPIQECPTVTSKFNVLVVTARPDLDEDVPYRLVSKNIWKTLQTSSHLRQHIKIKFVRPGTWDELLKELNSKNKGYYHLIHFDTHGGVDRTSNEAYLIFAPSSPESRNHIRISATTVAKVIKNHGIHLAFLNACNSADVRQSPTSNLAYTFAYQGIAHVVAMCAKVKSDTASTFVGALYRELFLNGRDINEAATLARSILRTNSAREARFSLTVDCDDSCLPILYQSSDCIFRWQNLDPNECKFTEVSNTTIGGVSENQLETENEFLIESSTSRGLDILYLERQLSYAPCVLVSGIGGIGKTSFARYLSKWWVDSEYLSRALYLDRSTMFIQKSTYMFSEILNCLDSVVYKSLLPAHGTSAPDGECRDLIERQAEIAITEGQYGLLVDDLDDITLQSDNTTSNIRRLMAAFQTSNPRARLLFSSDPSPNRSLNGSEYLS